MAKACLFVSFKCTDNSPNKTTDKSWEFNRIKFHEFPLLFYKRARVEIALDKPSRLFTTNNMPS